VNKTCAKEDLSRIDVLWWLTESPASVGVGAANASLETTTIRRVLAFKGKLGSCRDADAMREAE
jgi:hypothetical protein